MKDISCRSCAYFHDVVMFGQTDRQKDNPIYRVYAHKISTTHFRYNPSKKTFSLMSLRTQIKNRFDAEY